MEPRSPPGPLARVVLCLSGGGFRATFFHLGVVRFLRDNDLLRRVTHVLGVSGGSILAAHLAQNWERYVHPEEAKFAEAAEELIAFGRSDVRGRILRAWLVACFCLGAPLYARRWRRASLLERAYSALYHGRELRSLDQTKAGGPQFHILTASMTTGRPCRFTKDGFVRDEGRTPRAYGGASLPLAFAVAASSAFPPLFPPACLPRAVLGADTADFPFEFEYLTDGGVFDNLGLWWVRTLADAGEPADVVVVSDASAPFDWDVGRSFWPIHQRTARATEILMNRVATLERDRVRALGSDGAVFVSIDHVAVAPEGQVQDASVQSQLKRVRTDLDAFSANEIRALVQHGYEVAQEALGTSAPRPPWDPLPREARATSARLVREIDRSRRRRPGKGVWTLVVLLLLLALLLALGWGARESRRGDFGAPQPSRLASTQQHFAPSHWHAASRTLPEMPRLRRRPVTTPMK